MTLNSLSVQTPAKINPVLEVLGKRNDGFHELALVFQAIGLFDDLDLEKADSGVELSIEESPSPLEAGDSNLVVKAAKLFIGTALRNKAGVRMRLHKRIPLAAGLGGGSSDAAAALVGLNLLFGAGLPDHALAAMASQLGSDVPFFLKGGTAFGTGRGETITTWDSRVSYSLVLVKPFGGLSTMEVYRSDKALLSSGERARQFRTLWEKGDGAAAGAALFNGLEPSSFYLMPSLRDLKDKIFGAGALGALVAGSGPTVFGIAKTGKHALEIAEKLKDPGFTLMTAQTISSGVQIKSG